MKRLVYRALLTVNITFVIALFISYLAVHISPGDFVLPAFFGLAYPYLLLINLLFVIIWTLFLRFEAIFSIIAIALGFNHLTNYMKIGRHTGELNGTFKVISYNVRLFNSFENKRNPASESGILTLLKTQQPDILCLQEFYGTGNLGQKERAINVSLGGNYFSHLKIIGSGKNRFYGIATFSKFPIIRRGEFIHPGSSSLSIFTDVIIKKDTFRIFNNHLQSFRLKSMERSFFEEITDYEEDKTIGQLRNISASLSNGFVLRAKQAKVVKSQISNSPYPVIVAGDFNDTPVSFSYRTIRKGLNDSFVTSGYGAGFTYKGNYPPNRIDYILYTDALESSHFDIIKARFSDHYPIVSWLRKKN